MKAPSFEVVTYLAKQRNIGVLWANSWTIIFVLDGNVRAQMVRAGHRWNAYSYLADGRPSGFSPQHIGKSEAARWCLEHAEQTP